MHQLLLILLLTGIAWVDEKIEAKGEKVEHDVHTGHFESNKSGLKGDTSFLAFTDLKSFEQVFGTAAIAGKKLHWVPKNAFEKKMVVAVIHRGKSPYEYKVDRVTADGDTLYVQYAATAKEGAGTASFASPLILTVDRGKYTSVVFIENGKKAGTAEIGK